MGDLNAALALAAADGVDAVLSAGCDLPGLPHDLAARLRSRDAAYRKSCPIVGLWPASVGPPLAAHLATTTDRSLRAWAHVVAAAPIDLAFANINRSQDLAAYSIEASNLSTGHVANVVSESAKA